MRFWLQTCGPFAVLDDRGEVHPLSARKRVVAMLALVAAAGPDGISREELWNDLWPDRSAERVRNSFKQLIFVCRRSLDPRVFRSTHPRVRLNPDVLGSDVSELVNAHRLRTHRRFVDLYRGPFLEGLQIPDHPELEHLIEDLRERLQGWYIDALEYLARSSAELEERTIAWERLSLIDPLNPRVAAGLVAALQESGRLRGAADVARRHERLVRREVATDLTEAHRASARPSVTDRPRESPSPQADRPRP